MVRIKRFNESNIFDGDFLVKLLSDEEFFELSTRNRENFTLDEFNYISKEVDHSLVCRRLSHLDYLAEFSKTENKKTEINIKWIRFVDEDDDEDEEWEENIDFIKFEDDWILVLDHDGILDIEGYEKYTIMRILLTRMMIFQKMIMGSRNNIVRLN